MQDLTVYQLHQIVGGRLRMATLPPPAGEAAPPSDASSSIAAKSSRATPSGVWPAPDTTAAALPKTLTLVGHAASSSPAATFNRRRPAGAWKSKTRRPR